LAFGLASLADSPPDVVIVIDADCRVAPEAIDLLARQAAATGRPVQACYLFESPVHADATRAVSSFGLRFKNYIRPLGLSRVGLPCQLMGSGMAFPWPVIASVSVDNTALAEDTQLGIDLVLKGHPPLFCPEARVTTDVPASHQAHLGQRRRWEHGYLMTMCSQGPRLAGAFLRTGRWAALAAAIDFTVPPVALLILAWGVATLATFAVGVLTDRWLSLLMLSAAGIVLASTALAAWARFCRRQIPVAALLAIPWYVARKLPIYGSFLWRRQKVWLKTERDLN
jgi:cellulose synthase/poly-beta-1,6-N-acetylglucosamine synthase-like glycosyltransferase